MKASDKIINKFLYGNKKSNYKRMVILLNFLIVLVSISSLFIIVILLEKINYLQSGPRLLGLDPELVKGVESVEVLRYKFDVKQGDRYVTALGSYNNGKIKLYLPPLDSTILCHELFHHKYRLMGTEELSYWVRLYNSLEYNISINKVNWNGRWYRADGPNEFHSDVNEMNLGDCFAR